MATFRRNKPRRKTVNGLRGGNNNRVTRFLVRPIAVTVRKEHDTFGPDPLILDVLEQWPEVRSARDEFPKDYLFATLERIDNLDRGVDVNDGHFFGLDCFENAIHMRHAFLDFT